MSGLRAERREVAVLLTLIFAALPPEPRWCIREQARFHKGLGYGIHPVGASLLAKRPEQAAQL
jgi:hypothetical protein